MSKLALERARINKLKNSSTWGFLSVMCVSDWEIIPGKKGPLFPNADWIRKNMGSGLLHNDGFIGNKLPGKRAEHQIYPVEDPPKFLLQLATILKEANRAFRWCNLPQELVKARVEKRFILLETQLKMLVDIVGELGGPVPKNVIKTFADWRTKALPRVSPKPLKSFEPVISKAIIKLLKEQFPQASITCISIWTVELLKLAGINLKAETVRKMAAKIITSLS